MSFFTAYNTELQVVAAFLIFIAGYLALFLSLMICLIVGLFIHEGAKRVGSHIAGAFLASSDASSKVETPQNLKEMTLPA
jgi:hypothetical protein